MNDIILLLTKKNVSKNTIDTICKIVKKDLETFKPKSKMKK